MQLSKFFSFLFFSAAYALASQQLPAWDWARKADSTFAMQGAHQIRADYSGNIYTLGFNNGKCRYSTTVLDSGFFVAKHKNDGTFLWALNVPAQVSGIFPDNQGELYIAGSYTGTLQFANSTPIVSAGKSDIFVLKLNANGGSGWIKSFGSNENDYGFDVIVNNRQEIFVTGSTSKPVSFGNSAVSDTGFYLAKMDAAGFVNWARAIPTSTFTDQNYNVVKRIRRDRGYKLTSGPQGNVYILGNESAACMYCQGTFLAEFDPAGNQVFFKSAWDVFEAPNDIAVDKSKNIYVIYNTGSHYSWSPLLQKYDSLLKPIWNHSLGWGYGNYIIPYGLTLDGDDHPAVTGPFGPSGYGQFDTLKLDGYSLVPKGKIDMMVVSMDKSNGNIRWIKTAGGYGNDMSNGPFRANASMCSDRAGNLFLTFGIFAPDAYTVSPFVDTCYFDAHYLSSNRSMTEVVTAKLRLTDFNYEDEVLSVSEKQNPQLLRVSPNPGTGYFCISRNQQPFAGRVHIEDLSGRLCLSEEVSDGHINVTRLKDGFYFFVMEDEQGTELQKIILMHQ